MITNQKINIILEFITKNTKGFNAVMGKNMQQFKEVTTSAGTLNKRYKNMNSLGAKLAFGMRKLTHGMRGFRMEMLGIMFFGMAITRTIKGLISTSLEWMGVTEVFTTALGILFLPVAEILLDWALWFLDVVTEMPEETKKWIAKIVLLGLALGTALTIIGAVALGIGSLILVLGSLVTPLAILIAGFVAIGGFIWLKNFFDSISDKAGLADEKLTGFGITGGILTKLVDKMKEKFIEFVNWISNKKNLWIDAGTKVAESVFEGIKNFIYSNPLLVVGAMIGGWIGGPVGAMIGAALGSLFGKIKLDKMKEIIDKGFEILQGLMDGLKQNKDKIGEIIKHLIEQLGIFLNKNIGTIIELGWTIAKAILSGLFNFLKNNPGLVIGAIIGGIVGSIGGPWGTAIGAALGGAAGSDFQRRISSFQTGGVMPYTGLAYLHKGETIIPAGSSPSITINAVISNDYDVRRLAEELKRYWVADYERVSAGRSI